MRFAKYFSELAPGLASGLAGLGMSESQRLESSILFGLSTTERLGNRIAADAAVLADRDRQRWQRMSVVRRGEG